MIRDVRLRSLPTLSQVRQRDRAAAYLQDRLPGLPLYAGAPELPEVRIQLSDWQHERARIPNFDRLLRRLEAGGDFRLILAARDWLSGAQAAYEILNRYQRLLPGPRLAADQGQFAARCLALHGVLSPPSQGPTELERVGQLDCWCWLHRLEPVPPEELQLAALFGGDIYVAERELLRDARDLAFFNTRSWYLLEEQGYAASWTEVRRRVGRLSEAALCLALMTRQPPAISQMLEDMLDARGGHAVA